MARPEAHLPTGGENLETQQDDLKTPGVDDPLLCGTNCVPAGFGSIDFSTSLLVNGIVPQEPEVGGVAMESHHKGSEGFEETRQGPCSGPEPTMVGVMSVNMLGIAELKNRRDETAAGAQNPAFENVLEKNPAFFVENSMHGLHKLQEIGYTDHGRSSNLKMGIAFHLHRNRGTATSGTGFRRKSAKVHFD